jgi:DNA invertase Pin-like site-specific DNA recombinase
MNDVIVLTNEDRDFRKKRVAAYCRVSTDKELQKSSLELQTETFRQTILSHPDWELVRVYADEGLTGTSAKQRVQFKKMISDAKRGKIDYILAKSISRFARNTVDALKYTRELKELGVGVYFDEQSLDTLSVTSEIFLTIHAAFAQEESHSISENQKRGYRNRFALGIPKWSNTYGYRCDETDKWIIEQKEAVVVRKIFDMYIKGFSLPEISDYLVNKKIAPPVGEVNWYAHTLSVILHNEKYIGDVEMQKCYVTDHLTHKKISNKDKKLPKYYKKNHHTAIVSNEVYELAQIVLQLRNTHRGSIQYPFYGYLKCPHCGENMVGITLKTRGLERAWTCGGKEGEGTSRRERSACPPACVKEKYIIKALATAFREKEINIPSVEYYWLREYVESVTFVENDWSKLVVNWLDGAQTVTSICYEKNSEIPTEKVIIDGDDIYFDGKFMGATFNDSVSAKSVLGIMEYLQDVKITDDEICPFVLRPGTTKGTKRKSSNSSVKIAV